MKIHEIPEGSIILTPSSNHLELTLECLKLNKKAIRFMSLSQYRDTFSRSTISELEILYMIHEEMKKVKEELVLFKNQAATFAFEKECLSFLNQLHTYQISLEELPEDTMTQKELKTILSCLYSIPNPNKTFIENVHNIQDASNLYILYPHASYQENYILNILIKKNAHIIDIEHDPTYEYYHVGNIRQEAEAVAQMIIDEQLPSSSVRIACCDNKGLSFVSQVFSRLGIPHTSLTQTYPAKCTQQVIHLFKFSLDDSVSNLYNLLENHCLGTYNHFLQAQKVYPIHWKENYPVFNHESLQTSLWNDSEIDELLSLIEKANEEKQECYELLEKLTSQMDVKERLILIDEIVRQQMDPSETSIMVQIQKLFVEAHTYIQDKEDYVLLMDAIDQLRSSSSHETVEPLIVSQLKECGKDYDTLFIMNTSQNNFPGFVPLSGVFDENYVANIKNYPTLDERYQQHQTHMLFALRQAKRVVVFRALNEFSGKSIGSSLDIEEALQISSKAYTIHEQKPIQHKQDNLTSDIAHSLYTKENVLKGSVSALEKYVGCPYAYFLHYGLKLKEPIELGFNVAKIGSLNHAILETLVKKKGKLYTKTSSDEIEQLLVPYIEDLHVLFPQIPSELMKRKLIHTLSWNLKYLDEIEEHSSNKPSEVEKEFNHTYDFGSYKLALKGIIDRVDHNESTFTILDYKSSTKKLDYLKVFSGQQLQLMTYLTHLAQNNPKRPLGAFYYALNNPSLSLPFEKINRSKKLIQSLDDETIFAKQVSSNKLQGWFFEDSKEYLDDNKKHVATLNKNRILDIDEMTNKVNEILGIISNHILNGEIEIEPNKDACLFCKYHSICRFSGEYTEKKPIVELPACFGEGEDTNEEME